MLYARQKELLYMISRLKEVGKTKLQKLEFLSCLNFDKPTYSFFPYRFGPYSLILQKDLDYLVANGYVNFTNEMYSCANTAIQYSDTKRISSIDSTLKRFKDYSATGLMAYLYRAYPYFAIRSERAKELLTCTEMQEVINSYPDLDTPYLFTIGYEGQSIDAFLDALIANGIALLVDVRANGISMKPEFSSKRLAASCALVGIRYLHVPKLGIASEKRKGDYNKAELFQEYRHRLRYDISHELDYLFDKLQEAKRIAFTCFEKMPQDCHRLVVAEELLQLHNLEIALEHL